MRNKTTAALVKYRKIVAVEDFDQWTWKELVDAALKAKELRSEIDDLITSSYGDYIARLTLASAVKRGGIKEFCEETGFNYGTVKNWRSRYLSEEQKRIYRSKEPEPEPEPERIVIIDDNSADEPGIKFQDMFDGTIRNAQELVVSSEEAEFMASFNFVVSSNIHGRKVDAVLIDNFLQYYADKEKIRSLTISFESGVFIRVERS